jgi:pantoate--beta-alanine ligase
MIELSTITSLRRHVHEQRSVGRRVGLVPTMGYLHEGHLSLVDAVRRRADLVVMTIFVNPLQFAPEEDLERYPRDLARDRAAAGARGVDALFVPSEGDMYPPGSEIRIVPGEAGARWEGRARPTHFSGVLTVVAKLFHLVQPDVACFGQKDIQQATLIRQMVRDLNWPIEVLVAPTVREADGLALSSRNVYLDPEERRQAASLSAALAAAHQAWLRGERRAAAIEGAMRPILERQPRVVLDYIAIAEPLALAPVEQVDGDTVVAIAARLGRTRLLDNIILGKGLG